LLAGLEGIGAVLIASWLLKLLLALLPENFPRIAPIHIDAWVLGFSSGVALLTALILGTVPALQKSKANLSESLKGNCTLVPGAPPHRFRGGLAIAEVALASVLLVGAGLMTKSYWVLTHTHLGFNPQNVLAVATWPPGSGTARRDAYYQELFQRVQRLPNVQEVALVDSLPLLGTDAATSIRVPGRLENREMVGQRSISDDYFHVLQIPLIRGRVFSGQDTETSEKVVIINNALARRYFGQDDPIGQTILIFESLRVVGVVGDVKPNGFESLVVPEMYFPFRQWNTFGLRLLVRSRTGSEALAPSIRSEISAMDPAQVVEPIRPLEQILATQISPRRFTAMLLGCFAVVGLAIALIGIYGVMSYSVSRRTHEFGVRMALGAQRGEVLNMVLRQGVLLALTGAGLGLAGAWALTRLLSNLLYEVKPTDATTYVAVSLCLIGVASLACLPPALRATRVEPMKALRYE
jgi:putative ABC transport system permease protein